MIILNLISPAQKRLLKIKQFYLLLENFLGVLVINSTILAIVLTPIHQSINQLNLEINNKKQEIELKNQNITAKVDDLNKQIEILSKVQESFYNWPEYLLNLSRLVPEEISLNKVSNTLETKEFIIRGYAKNRDGLIKFKENLENSPIFKKVNIPLSNFLTQQEITFEISGWLN